MAKLKTELSGKGSNIRVEREYAKRIGVRSPTTLSKARLDEAVRRRELELGITREKYNIYDFTADERRSLGSAAYVKTSIQMLTGFFKPFPEGDGILRRDPFSVIPENDVYVSVGLAEKYGMLPGDRVVGDVGVVPYNHRVRMLKNVRYINEEPSTRRSERIPFDDIPAVVPSSRIRIYGNNAVLGIVQDILCLGQGQSLVISGLNESNAVIAENAAVDLLKGLYMSFDGNVFGIFDGVSEKCRYSLSSVVNPETMIIDGEPDEYAFLLEMMKRSVERKVPAAAVLYMPGSCAGEFAAAAKATSDASLTVIILTDESVPSQARMRLKGGLVEVKSLVNEGSAYVCGEQRHRKIFRVLSAVGDGTPDEVLAKFTELVEE